MCKIAFIDRRNLKELEQSDLYTLFQFLSTEPDGFGIAFKFPNKIEILKAHKPKFTPKDWAELVYIVRHEVDWVLIHARKASRGLKTDFYCQPFFIEEDKSVLVHNGDYEFSRLEIRYLNSLGIRARTTDSDTYIITKVIREYGKKFLKYFYGSFNTFVYGDFKKVILYGDRLNEYRYGKGIIYHTPDRAKNSKGFITPGIAVLYPEFKAIKGDWAEQNISEQFPDVLDEFYTCNRCGMLVSRNSEVHEFYCQEN